MYSTKQVIRQDADMHFRINAGLKQKLEQCAKQNGTKASDVMRGLIEAYVTASGQHEEAQQRAMMSKLPTEVKKSFEQFNKAVKEGQPLKITY